MKTQTTKSTNRPSAIYSVIKLFSSVIPLALAVSVFAAAEDEPVLIDFGRHDDVNGHVTASPDGFGQYWNNMGPTTTTVPQFTTISSLVTVSNNLTSLAIEVRTSNMQCNGTANGGLLSPDSNLLGDYAVGTATEDYFFVNGSPATGTLRFYGLDPARQYKFSMYATRDTTETRVTRYSVTDFNGPHTVSLQTSGAGAGVAPVPNGNNDTIVELTNLIPDASGQLDLSFFTQTSAFAYLGILKITPLQPTLAFFQQPLSVEVASGTSTSMTAYATSPSPIDYRWYFEGNLVVGATGTNLPLPNLTVANQGNYFVTASNSFGVITSAVARVTIGPDHLGTNSILVDFGRHDGEINGIETFGPDANGNYWNNIGTSDMLVPETLSVGGLVKVDGSVTSLGLTVISNNFQCNGTQNGGLLTPHYALLGDFAIPTASEDYFFVNDGSSGITGAIRIFGLDPGTSYKLRLFATRNTDAGTTRTTRYSVTDVNGLHSAVLQTSGPGAGSTNQPFGNDDTIAELNGLKPNGAGELDLSVTEVAGLYAYLGILEITLADPVPTFVVNPQSMEVAPGASSNLTAYAISVQPLNYQWYFNGNTIAGATGTNLPLPNIAATNAGSYYLIASNVTGVATSSVATVVVGPEHLLKSSVLVDFSRNDGGNGHDTTSPDANGNYWNNIATTTGTVPQDLAINNLVTVDNTPTTIGLTITSGNFQNNGRNNGGLLAPHYGLMGDFAIASATEDYFFVNGTAVTGTMRISGLNPAKKYDFFMFGTRNTDAGGTRTTKYSVTDANGLHSVNLQTSGPGSGDGTYPYGNNDTIVSLNGLIPDGSGNLDLGVTEVNGSFAYLGILQIIPSAEATFALPTPISGGWRLQFNAAPGYTYRVQRAAEVTGPWVDLGSVISPGNGQCLFDDTNAPASKAFYRTIVP